MARRVICLLLLILMAYAFLTLLGVFTQLQQSRELLGERLERAGALRAENAALRQSVEHFNEAENIERLAREKLGLVYPGETVTYNSVGD